MKTISKIVAMVLAFTMLLSLSAFAATIQEGTNGETIDISFIYSATNKVGGETDTYASGASVYVFVQFEGNVEGSTGMANIDMPIGYDADKLTISAMTEALPGGYANNIAYADDVAWLTWYNANGAYDTDEEEYILEGTLTRIKFTAKTDINAADIASGNLVYIMGEAIAKVDGSVGKFAAVDVNGAKLTVNVPDVAAEDDEFKPETVKAAAVTSSQDTFDFAKNANYTDTYTNIGVYTASIAAATKSEAGFIWVKDGVETAHKFPFDVEDVAGGGTFDYTVAMYGIPTGVTITAIPYYVTAE